ncbi:DUF2169 domain-containing protein [Bordetella tumulicola]
MKIAKPADVMVLLGRQSRGGQPSLTITVGYACAIDGTRLTDRQAWAWLAPMFNKEPFDLGEKKERGCFAVGGMACAPAGQTVTGLTVRAGVGDLQKSVLVQGDRTWTRGITGWQTSAPQPFERMPLSLAHAYGAAGWPHNPHGRGHCADPNQADAIALPNIEHPRHPVLKPADVPPLATLGPLPQGSPERARWLGTLDGHWQRHRLPWLPDDTDPRWFDRVQQDQCQDGYWRGDEPWFAEHMHPKHAVLRGKLPGLRPRLLLRGDRAPEHRAEVPLDLDTVWLFPTDERVLVLYRASVAVRREDAVDILGLAVFTETQDQAAQSTEHWAEVWRQQQEKKAKPAIRATPVAAQADAARAAVTAAAAEAAAQAASAHKQTVLKTIAEARQAGIDEADRVLTQLRQPTLSSRLAQAEASAADDAPLAPATWPREPAAFALAVRNYVKAQLAAGEAHARATLKQYGQDFDEIVARSQTHSPNQVDDPAAILASLPLTPEKKQAVLQEYQAFQSKMSALEAKAADLRQRAEAVRSANAPPAPPTINEPLPSGARTLLDRETLLARHAVGQSCAWALLQDLDLTGVSLRGVDLSRALMQRCILRNADLENANFQETELQQCDFVGARLDQSRFSRAQLTECMMDGASASGADFTQARLKAVSLANAGLTKTQWRHAQVEQCGFDHAFMQGAQAERATFKACRLSGVNAARAQLQWVIFNQCELTNAVFDEAILAKTTLFASQAAGASFVNARMPGLRTQKGADLSRARLDRAQMDGASLQDSCFVDASLRETRLDRGLIKNCDLSGSDAWHLVARGTNFVGSRVAQASWRGANLMKSRWSEAVLEDVDMTGVNLHAADTRRVQAQGVQLEQALLTRCRLIEDYARD